MMILNNEKSVNNVYGMMKLRTCLWGILDTLTNYQDQQETNSDYWVCRRVETFFFWGGERTETSLVCFITFELVS